MKYTVLIVLLVVSFSLYSQETYVSGNIQDIYGNYIENASIIIKDIEGNTRSYSLSDDVGNFSINVPYTQNKLYFTVSSLGYKSQTIPLGEKIIDPLLFILTEQAEKLDEIVIETFEKITIDQDTTTIKVGSFKNATEQTVEDILKKLPGIEVLRDGSIKAHGIFIDKLLVEGEDLFAKNYKMLSKNLDAKVLDAIQIIDNFEDNPILDQMNNTEKVALNLKLKDDKKNIWFGNVNLGAGIVSEKRWNEGINLGLLKKKIKLFYLGDYNNLGGKATNQVQEGIIEEYTFSDDRYERTATPFFEINSNENLSLSKSQNIFNEAIFNSANFVTKVTPVLSLRGAFYVASDRQTHESRTKTIYNIAENPLVVDEEILYKGNTAKAAAELELKYNLNDNNHLTNTLIFQRNPTYLQSDITYNTTAISQNSRNDNLKLYNHLNHSIRLSENKILTTYLYLGKDHLNQQSIIKSPLLNQYLNLTNSEEVSQLANNSLLYYGVKSKFITDYKKLSHVASFNYESSTEMMKNYFTSGNTFQRDLENNTLINQNIYSFGNALRYRFTPKLELTGTVDLLYNHRNNNSSKIDNVYFNYYVKANLRRTKYGTFTVNYSENYMMPSNQYLINGEMLKTYNSFLQGSGDKGLLKNQVIALTHVLFQDKNRFSLNSAISYIKAKNMLAPINTITPAFTFSDYESTEGGETYNATFNVVNYLRPLRLATKFETSQNWSTNPVIINDLGQLMVRSKIGSYGFSATTFFSFPLNLDFGATYVKMATDFNHIKSENYSTTFFIKSNLKVAEKWLAEIHYDREIMKDGNYTIVNAVATYEPAGRFTYRLVLNNLMNQDKFTLKTLDQYSSYTSTVKLIPRYMLLNIKYRF